MNEQITLFSTKDGADKEYRASLDAKDGGFVVTGYNGRRGGTLKAQPKTPVPVPYAEAKATFDALVKSKIKGGYTPGENDGSAYVAAAVGVRIEIGLHRLTAVSESDIERYLTDDAFFAQEKFDGERRPVVRNSEVVGCNLNGFAVALPGVLAKALSKLPQNTEIDAEVIGDALHVFDAMKIDGIDIRALGALERMRRAESLVEIMYSHANVTSATTAIGTEAKRALYSRLRLLRKEGIVFKRIDSLYAFGINEDQIKVKFIESATLQVASVHATKRSVGVQAFDADGTAVLLGNVTISAKHSIPAVGEIVEVEYLYTVRNLVQPVYKGVRTDRTVDACTTSQLKYRAGIGEDDAENDDAALLAA